jgi:hypothetical protein
MKTRNGFISNSSSSSFILALDKRPGSPKEAYQLMFPDGEPVVEDPWTEALIPGMDIATRVFTDLQKTESMMPAQLTARAMSGRVVADDTPESPDSDNDKTWAQHIETLKEHARQSVDNLITQHPNSDFYIVVYSDKRGEGAMEHGDIFRHVPHVQISHH